jgi:hypothetical protein
MRSIRNFPKYFFQVDLFKAYDASDRHELSLCRHISASKTPKIVTKTWPSVNHIRFSSAKANHRYAQRRGRDAHEQAKLDLLIVFVILNIDVNVAVAITIVCRDVVLVIVVIVLQLLLDLGRSLVLGNAACLDT